MRAALTLALACLLGTTAAYAAQGPFLRLERLDTRRCGPEGMLVASLVEVSTDGRLERFAPTEYRLFVDGARGPAAKRARPFGQTKVPLSVSVVLQANLPYRDDMDRIVEQVQRLLRALPPRAKVSVISYGARVRHLANQQTPFGAAEKVAALKASDTPSSPLLDALRTALLDLGPADSKSRRMVIVLSDGVSEPADRDGFRAFGNLARARVAPVQAIAYSATDERAPLLNLSEIVKRSRGTFRWARTDGDISEQIDNLVAEIDQQPLLEFEVEDHCARPHRIEVAHGALRSNVLDTAAVDATTLQRVERAVGGRVVLIGLGVGGLLVLAAIAVLLSRRTR